MKYKNTIIEFYKYSIVGIVCGSIDIGVLVGLLYFFPTKQMYLLGMYNTIAYGLAVLNSYFWNARFTFKVQKNTKQFIVFIIQAIVSLFIADGVFLLGLWALGFVSFIPKWMLSYIAKGISMFISSTIGFFFTKYVVFQKQ